MSCPACQFENPPGLKFCGGCGSPLNLPCPGCGTDNPSEFKFCGQCGSALSIEDTPDRGTPAAYTPKHLADKVLTSRGALEGEKKQVTILFADVKGSMDLAGQLDPEVWHTILDRFFEILSEGVHRFEGTVNQYTGDGIMALFGAPIAHEDHARRACYAALHLRDSLSEYALEQRRERGLNFAVRMGINSGEVVVGKIGDDLRMDYTAQGLTVGLAQRMEQLAEPGRIYLTDHAARNAEGFFELDDMGEFNVKGVSGPMHVFDLQGLGRLRSRLEVSQARGFSTFVGRVDEMASLDTALKNTIDGIGQVVGVVGEAGVGKSRLCHEFIQKARANGVPVYESHCPAHGQTIPFLPILELWRNYFGVIERDTDEEARRKIAGTLVLLDDTLNESLPLLFDFLGVPDPTRPAPDLDPDARLRQLIAFTRRANKIRSDAEPSIIYIDDMHWIDPASDAFIGQFIETLDQSRTMLLLNFRPEYQAAWSHKPYYQQLPVVPLGSEAIDQLVFELLGDDDTVKTLPALIRKRTGGNPFFIEEVIQTLVESGTLEGGRGGYLLTTPVEALRIPDTVRAILAARIDRLADETKHVLQTAAVIGKEFIEPVLRQVVEVAVSELSTALQALQSAEFIYEQALYPVEEYTFKHPLTQEVALDTQLQERKRRIHAAVAQAIIGASANRLDENSALIAYHFEEAQEWSETAEWNGRAAKWVGDSDPVGAARHWQKVLDLGRLATATDEMDRLRLRACTAIQSIGGWRMGMTEEEVDAIHDEGVGLADKFGDTATRTVLDIQWAGYQSILGNTIKFVERATVAESGLDAIEDMDTRLDAIQYLAYGFMVAGDAERSRKYYKLGDEATGGDINVGLRQFGYSEHLWAVGLEGWLNVMCGDIQDGFRGIDYALAATIQHGQVELQCYATVWRFVASTVRGFDNKDLEELERQALEAVDMADRIGSSYAMIYTRGLLANAHAYCGRWDEAEAQGLRSLELMKEHNTALENEYFTRIALARAHAGRGNFENAEESIKKVLDDYALKGSVNYTVVALLVLAECILASPKATDRVSDIEKILDLSDQVVAERGEFGTAPQVIEGRARLAAITDDSETSVKLLQDAHTAYTKIGATGHATRLKNELHA